MCGSCDNREYKRKLQVMPPEHFKVCLLLSGSVGNTFSGFLQFWLSLPLVMISCKYQEWKDKWRQRNVLCVSNKTCKSTQFKQRAKMNTYRLQNIINRRAVDPTSHAQPVWKKNIAMIGKAVPCLSLLNDVEIVVLMCQKCNECLTMSQVSLGLFSKCLYICHCLFVGQVMSDHHSDHLPKVWEVSRTTL